MNVRTVQEALPGRVTVQAAADRERVASPGALLLAGLVTPLVAVGLLTHAGSADRGGPWQCPMLEATGVPCPGCGATRAFVHLANGDVGGALHYNWAWPALWLALAGWALVMLVRTARGQPAIGSVVGRVGELLRTRAWAAAAAAAVILVPTWLIALANLQYIG
jgi:Protein of unknown function (DUF2752)